MKTTKELLAEYNKLTGKNLTAWKQSREKLVEKVNLLTAALSPAEPTTDCSIIDEPIIDPIPVEQNPDLILIDDPLNGGKSSLDPHEGEKIGAFIQRLLLVGEFTTKELVMFGKNSFPTSKISASDVAWHRAYLKRQGVELKLVRVNKKGERYTKMNVKG